MNYVVQYSLFAMVSCVPLAAWTTWLVRRERDARAVRRFLVIASGITAVLSALAGLSRATFVGLITYSLGCSAKGGYDCEGGYLLAIAAVCTVAALSLLYRGTRASKAIREL